MCIGGNSTFYLKSDNVSVFGAHELISNDVCVRDKFVNRLRTAHDCVMWKERELK